jgi:ribonuclease VapC
VSEFVLDASALVALIEEELGADRVREAVPNAVVSSVNLSEVAAFLTQRGMPSPKRAPTWMACR